MNTVLAVALGGVMLVLIGRSLFVVIKDAQGLDARNRRLALITFTLIMVAFVAMVIMVHFRVG
jgi:H+/gluconate symporter-like permease